MLSQLIKKVRLFCLEKHLSDIPDLRIRMEYLHCRLGILIGRLLKHIFVN